ncbi:phage tail tape measure protein [Lysinibacillus sphaericus]|uniref:Phage-related tail protein n=1 Tax=Lysinibacillus sphaericus OT4b.31 TaxID=1285586 RepID=R7Z8C3_LYSSH|nr:phage tail tape measure protein [Lysinibacillus sphaericus]EON70397.1 phage-related tail protein [Lysinibacillus sphaericus OT4b.31]
MARAFELTFEIAGAVGRSFSNTFQRANTNLNGLRNRAREVQREMDRLGREYRQGNIHQSQYAESTARLSRELRQLEGSQRRVSALKSTFSSGMNTAKTVASVGAVGVAATATGVAMSSLKTAANFQQQMSKVSAISGATGADFEKLNAEAQNLGKSTVFSATQAAEGMEYLALAGWKTDAIISAMPGMLNLAAAGSMDLGRAADITSDTMQAFSMSADKAGHAADVFAYAQANANTNVEMIGEAMKYAAPTANQFKWSLEETSAAMMALANQGLKGSIAGQAFASSMGRLAADKGKIAEKAKNLGMEFFNAQGKMKSLPGLIKEIEKGTAGMSDKQRVNTLQTLFGAEAFKHWAILLSTGSDELQRMTTAMENSDGTASKMSATMVDNYAGSLQLLKSSIEGAQIKFMTPVLPVFQKFFGGITGTLDKNMGSIEKAGEATAKILSDITAPFSTEKPIKPKIEPNMDPADAQRMINQYNKELQKYEMFNDMGFGEKVEYMLDTAIQKAEAWLGGSGGEAMGRIFTQLGTIAGKAWIAGLTGAASGAVSSALEGNMSGALGLGAAAWMMGGGTLVKGAVGAGRWGMEKFNSRRATTSPPPISPNPPPTPPTPGNNGGFVGPNRTGTITRYGGGPTPPPAPPPAPNPTPSRGARIMGQVGKVGKVAGNVAGKAMLPLGIAMEGYNVYKSEDKVKATTEAASGVAGGLGGAKLGATIGSFIAPGIGTAIGGVLGGAVGYFGGKWLGGKAVDTVRGGSSATATSAPAPTPTNNAGAAPTQQLDVTKLNTSATALATALEGTNTSLTAIASSFTTLQTSASTTAVNMDNLTMYSGQVSTDLVTSFYSLKTATDLSNTNMATLASAIGQATGWITSIQGIQPAAQNVIAALNGLKTRIDNIQLPSAGGATPRRTQYE